MAVQPLACLAWPCSVPSAGLMRHTREEGAGSVRGESRWRVRRVKEERWQFGGQVFEPIIVKMIFIRLCLWLSYYVFRHILGENKLI